MPISRSLIVAVSLLALEVFPTATIIAKPATQQTWQTAIDTALNKQCRESFPRAEASWLNTLHIAESFPDNDPKLCETLYGLYQFYNQSKAYDKAISILKRFIAMRQRHSEDRFFYLASWHQCELADLYYKQQNWSQAIDQYKTALGSWEHTRHWLSMIQAYDRLALCHMHTGNRASSKQYFKASLECADKALHLPGLERQRYLVQYLKAQTLVDSGKPQQADILLADLTKQLKCPQTDLLQELATYYCRMGKYVESEIIYDMMNTDIAERCRREAACSRSVPTGYSQLLVSKSGTVVDNSFLREFSKLHSRRDFFCKKSALVSKYAYAIPTAAAINEFQKYQPIVEIGAGTGYWAFLMRKAGIKVIAYERYPLSVGKNEWFPGAHNWTEVLGGDEYAASKHPDSTLFLCWPPGRYPVAYNALRTFKGNHVIHVGAIGHGENEDRFQALLKKDWQLKKQVDLPQWIGDYEALFVYRRKQASK